MFDLDSGKLLIIGIVALVVIPPKDLPTVMRQAGQALGKLRRMAAEFQSQFMDAVREAELDEIRKNVTSLADSAKLDVAFDPVATVRDEIESGLAEGTIAAAPVHPTSGMVESGSEALLLREDAEEAEAPDEEAAGAGMAALVPSSSEEPSVAAASAEPEPAIAAPPVPVATAEPVAVAHEADARRT